MSANLYQDTTVVGYQFQINCHSSYQRVFLFWWSLFLFDRCFYLQKTHFEHTWSLEIIYNLILLLCVVVPTQVVVLHFFNSSCRSLSGLINKKELSSQQQNSDASAIKKTIADDIVVWKSGYQERNSAIHYIDPLQEEEEEQDCTPLWFKLWWNFFLNSRSLDLDDNVIGMILWQIIISGWHEFWADSWRSI